MSDFVSVIIPVYNGERFLAEAIASVLSQNHAPLEILVADDGSTDATARLVAGMQTEFGERVRYLFQARRGPAAARNLGLYHARGDVIAFLDHDDLWAPDCLSRHLAVLALQPEIEIVQGLIVEMQGVPVPDHPNEFRFKESSAPYQFISLSSAVYRKHVFERVGGFDETLWEGEDADWFLRAWEKNIHKVVLPRVILYARRHDTNMTQATGPHLLPRLFKMHLDRVRAASADAQASALEHPRAKIADYIGLPPPRRASPSDP